MLDEIDASNALLSSVIAPAITSGATGADLLENTGAGQTVYTITATAAWLAPTYAIGGADFDAGLLSVNASTGVVTLTVDPVYATQSSFSFTVTAIDAASNTSPATTVTFSITNVVESLPCNSVTFDGHTYDVVQIGDQCWFAENLRNEHYTNGDGIPGELSNSDWSTTSEGAQAIYNNDTSNLAGYGRLYNWHAVYDSRGLCPSAWHVPTDEEFMTLEMELGMSESEANVEGPIWRGTDQGTQMKSSASDSPAWDGTNTSGFSGEAGGNRKDYGDFSGEGGFGEFWSTSAAGTNAMRRELGGGNTGVVRGNKSQQHGFSVRCVRD